MALSSDNNSRRGKYNEILNDIHDAIGTDLAIAAG